MRRALDHGALGFIPKSADSDTIGTAVGQVLDGERWAPPAAHTAPAMDRDEEAVARRLRELSPRQFRVAGRLAVDPDGVVVPEEAE